MKYAFVAAAVFAGDFFLKRHMEEREFQEGTELLWGRVVLKKYHNKGAAMNFLSICQIVRICSRRRKSVNELKIVFASAEERTKFPFL